MCTKPVKWFLNLITFILLSFFPLLSVNPFASSWCTKYTIKHIVADTPHKRLFTPSITFMSAFPFSLDVRCAGAEYFMAAQLYIQLSLANRMSMMIEMLTTAKMDKQLVWMLHDGRDGRESWENPISLIVPSLDFYTKSFLCFTACICAELPSLVPITHKHIAITK